MNKDISKPMLNSSNSNSSSSYFSLDSANKFLPSEFSPLYHADQGLRNISNAVDSSLKNLIGKVSWLTTQDTSIVTNGISENTKKQMSENLILQTSSHSMKLEESEVEQIIEEGSIPIKTIEEEKITPTSSISTNDSNLITQNNVNNHSLKSDSSISLNNKSEPIVVVASPTSQEKFLSKFSNSMGGVIKNFRPISASSSSSSLNVHLEQQQQQQQQAQQQQQQQQQQTNGGNLSVVDSNESKKTPQQQQQQQQQQTQGKIRSRTTSLINPNLFTNLTSSLNNNNNNNSNTSSNNLNEKNKDQIQSSHRNSLSLFASSIENAFDNVKNRSRGSSMSDMTTQPIVGGSGNSGNNNQHRSSTSESIISGISHLRGTSISENNNEHSNSNGNKQIIITQQNIKEYKDKYANKQFEELSINELKNMYKIYMTIMEG
ncbi:hypothetical protein CANARDRAFT_30324 [[Candida] arabinofermentans NRRL YB-2248]|uniref:Uncharacterized protein n=1 Tax=[Candida] arabinofermentans NRRL YB-2248 TaxID=983967 RepID=A0A1E4SUA3_9ASCO|nr:hypothetical protein CANARDRAFT_30324 [[Candida] arabinofermentans NRRL YB-2248]